MDFSSFNHRAEAHTVVCNIVDIALEHTSSKRRTLRILNQAQRCCMQVNLSVVEIYCERIRDLLSSDSGSDNLVIQQDRQHGVYIAGATQVTSLMHA